MGEYDSTAETLKHIRMVQKFINKIIHELLQRADLHDETKLKYPEKPIFDLMTPELSGVSYGSKEYRAMLEDMKPAIDHHNKKNRHHIEHFKNGLDGMNIVDIVEMICDWVAAARRHADGDIRKSIDINKRRFKMDEQLVNILINTLDDMGW